MQGNYKFIATLTNAVSYCNRLLVFLAFPKRSTMKRICVLLFVLFYINALAQKTETEISPRKNIYLELGGNGIAFNVMYETRFKPGADGPGIKAGVGGFTTSYENLFTVPVGINWLLSKDDKNYFEAGFGATFLHYEQKYDYGFYPTYPTYPTEIINLTIDKPNSVYGHLTLGYRRQPAKGGIMWGVALTPHFNQNGFWPVWVGVKFGYSFAGK